MLSRACSQPWTRPPRSVRRGIESSPAPPDDLSTSATGAPLRRWRRDYSPASTTRYGATGSRRRRALASAGPGFVTAAPRPRRARPCLDFSSPCCQPAAAPGGPWTRARPREPFRSSPVFTFSLRTAFHWLGPRRRWRSRPRARSGRRRPVFWRYADRRAEHGADRQTLSRFTTCRGGRRFRARARARAPFVHPPIPAVGDSSRTLAPRYRARVHAEAPPTSRRSSESAVSPGRRTPPSRRRVRSSS